ncbi:DUF3073 domain-containing protein [Actinopolyspora erythraea]|uniref:DUF3073 domain-containing protein n=3 Tax=Actinopolyspora TaxID=1849 RepID=A0A099DAT3_9ACTN|nr:MULTISPECIES: DUF3073 domain-containing protein [Actinopolyspora]ASU80457.1 DUF3073 domain-containing protein [Actinopolyspora erythraea]KGI82872.1 hypothetical protein IL38_03140 [Actinopolyspora erythraea]SDP80084.1 Protein of unknown function [Actinopolyspora xinjiangensis]
MGRGRAKAKQTKVARELKYNSPSVDLGALERELSSDYTPEWYEEGDYYYDDDRDDDRRR